MRSSWVALALTAALIAVSLPASADFHPDCDGQATAYANTDLSYTEDPEPRLVYEGFVHCPDAEIEIEHLELTRYGPAGSQDVAATSAQPCLSALLEPCSASGSAEVDAFPAAFDVEMVFSTPSFEDVERMQRFVWDGESQPVPVCVHAGFVPQNAGVCQDLD